MENYTALGWGFVSPRKGHEISNKYLQKIFSFQLKKKKTTTKKTPYCLLTTHYTIVCTVSINALLVMGNIGDKAINQDRPQQVSKPIPGWKCLPGQRAASQQTGSPETRRRNISEGKPFQSFSPPGLRDGGQTPLSMQPRACACPT